MRRRNYSKPAPSVPAKPWFENRRMQPSGMNLMQRLRQQIPLFVAESAADAERIQRIADECGIRVEVRHP